MPLARWRHFWWSDPKLQWCHPDFSVRTARLSWAWPTTCREKALLVIHGGSCLRAVSTRLLRCKLKSVIARVVFHPAQTLSRNKICYCKLKKKLSKKVDASSIFCNVLLQFATTKFCCVTMFQLGVNTVQQHRFQLATKCCVASWRKMFLVLPGLNVSEGFWPMHTNFSECNG